MKRASGAVLAEERGALFEGMVVRLLRAYRDYIDAIDEMRYWVPSTGTTLDVGFRGLSDLLSEGRLWA